MPENPKDTAATALKPCQHSLWEEFVYSDLQLGKHLPVVARR